MYSGNEGFVPKYSHYKRPSFPDKKKNPDRPRKRSNVVVYYVTTFLLKNFFHFFSVSWGHFTSTYFSDKWYSKSKLTQSVPLTF